MVLIVTSDDEKCICVGIIGCIFIIFSLVSAYVFDSPFKWFILTSVPLSLFISWIWIVKTPDEIRRDLDNKYPPDIDARRR